MGGGWGGAEWPIQPLVKLAVGVLLAPVDPWPVQGAQAHGVVALGGRGMSFLVSGSKGSLESLGCRVGLVHPLAEEDIHRWLQ